MEDVPGAVRLLIAGHPAMAPLWRLGSDVLSAPTPAEGARTFLGRLDADAEAGRVLAGSLPPWVMTISWSSTVLATLRGARLGLVSCMESLPGGEGRRMAEAVEEFARSRIVGDDEAIRLVPAAAVVVGADAVTPHGLVNKVKTRALAEAARAKGIPCYAVAGETKFVPAPLPLDGPFESTPLELFEAIATPWGLLRVAEARARAEEAALPVALHDFLAELRPS